MEYKTVMYIFLNILMTLVFVIGIIDCSKVIFTHKIKEIKNKSHKYVLLSLFISSIVIYIIYIPLLISKDSSSWLMALCAYILTSTFNRIYTKNKSS